MSEYPETEARRNADYDREVMKNFPQWKHLDEISDPGPDYSMDTGIMGLYTYLRIPCKGLMNIIGPYGGGKSSFVRRILYNLCKDQGKVVAITCLEEAVKNDVLNIFRRMHSGKEVDKMTKEETFEADNLVREKMRFIKRQEAEIFNGYDLTNMLASCFQLKNAPDVFVIDPWNEIDHRWDRKEFQSKTDYVGDLIIRIKTIAEHYRKLVIIVAHPPADQVRKKKMSQLGEFYDLSDAADSMHFANKADVGLGIWKNVETGETIVNIDKIKNRRLCGALNISNPYPVALRFDDRTDSYSVVKTGGKEVFGGDEK